MRILTVLSVHMNIKELPNKSSKKKPQADEHLAYFCVQIS